MSANSKHSVFKLVCSAKKSLMQTDTVNQELTEREQMFINLMSSIITSHCGKCINTYRQKNGKVYLYHSQSGFILNGETYSLLAYKVVKTASSNDKLRYQHSLTPLYGAEGFKAFMYPSKARVYSDAALRDLTSKLYTKIGKW